MSKKLSSRTRTVLVTSIAAWTIALAFGFRSLLLYANTPGHLASPPADWPMTAPMKFSRGNFSLLVFAHPECPCSRATLGELAVILARSPKPVKTTVFFYRPRSVERTWAETDLWKSAAAMPDVKVVDDPDSEMARRFGAGVSGQVLLYDVSGHLAFNGGITASRGHFGDNDGLDAVLAILRDQTLYHRTSPVFGCSLYSKE
jgi:hypothetical protein